MKILGKLKRYVFPSDILEPSIDYHKSSYSQTGEDVIVDFIFEQLKINKPTFLDIGAHHPFYINNTFLFYKKGFYGVNIEPDPLLIRAFEKYRPNDKNLNIGIGFLDDTQEADFYLMSVKTLNTFLKEEAQKYQSSGAHKIEEVIKVPLVSCNKIIELYFGATAPNFVSIDVEGLDFEIIKSFDFKKFRPEIFCIETLTYSENNSEKKLNNIINYVCSKDYMIFADTYINTIFVDKVSWQKR
jgi:FkbM family methyltransferase